MEEPLKRQEQEVSRHEQAAFPAVILQAKMGSVRSTQDKGRGRTKSETFQSRAENSEMR